MSRAAITTNHWPSNVIPQCTRPLIKAEEAAKSYTTRQSRLPPNRPPPEAPESALLQLRQLRPLPANLTTMAPTLPASAAAMLARRQLTRAPASASSLMMATRTLATPYHQQQRGYATPKGAPPQNFRTSKPVEWVWEKDSLLDRLGKYFLMTEMARGMYVLLEQFFRPPYVISTMASGEEMELLTEETQLHHLLSFREGMQVARGWNIWISGYTSQPLLAIDA